MAASETVGKPGSLTPEQKAEIDKFRSSLPLSGATRFQPNPLSKADRSAAQKAYAALGCADEQCRIAEFAGLPVEEQRLRIEHLRGILTALLAVYDRDQVPVPE